MTDIALTIDDQEVVVPEGTTILQACGGKGGDIPTLCYGDTITPKNACRVCMVEVEGSRVLAPSCSRQVEPGMSVKTRSDRVDHARKMVLEFLGSSVDLSLTAGIDKWNAEYHADPTRYGPQAETVAQPVKVDNDLYVRDYAKCILCYQCVDACGEQWQNSFVIDIVGRGFDARVSTENDVSLLCVLRQLHSGLPDRCTDVQERIRHARGRNLARRTTNTDRHDLRILRCGLQPHPPRAGQLDREGYVASRQRYHQWQFVHQGPIRLSARPKSPRLTQQRWVWAVGFRRKLERC